MKLAEEITCVRLTFRGGHAFSVAKFLGAARQAGNHSRFRKNPHTDLTYVKDLRQNQYRYMPAAMQVGHNFRNERKKDFMSTRCAKYSCACGPKRYNL